MRNLDEIIVYLMRVYKWPLEYTRNLVRTMPVKDLNILIAETDYQERMATYQQSYNFALILSAICSSDKRKYKPSDFIGKQPERKTNVSKPRPQTEEDTTRGNPFYTLPPEPECA